MGFIRLHHGRWRKAGPGRDVFATGFDGLILLDFVVQQLQQPQEQANLQCNHDLEIEFLALGGKDIAAKTLKGVHIEFMQPNNEKKLSHDHPYSDYYDFELRGSFITTPSQKVKICGMAVPRVRQREQLYKKRISARPRLCW